MSTFHVRVHLFKQYYFISLHCFFSYRIRNAFFEIKPKFSVFHVPNGIVYCKHRTVRDFSTDVSVNGHVDVKTNRLSDH